MCCNQTNFIVIVSCGLDDEVVHLFLNVKFENDNEFSMLPLSVFSNHVEFTERHNQVFADSCVSSYRFIQQCLN